MIKYCDLMCGTVSVFGADIVFIDTFVGQLCVF